MSSEYEVFIYEVETITATLSDIASLVGNIAIAENVIGDITVPDFISYDHFDGPYEVTPSAHEDIVLATNEKLMDDDVTVFKIPYFETSNTSGYTVYIASEV